MRRQVWRGARSNPRSLPLCTAALWMMRHLTPQVLRSQMHGEWCRQLLVSGQCDRRRCRCLLCRLSQSHHPAPEVLSRTLAVECSSGRMQRIPDLNQCDGCRQADGNEVYSGGRFGMDYFQSVVCAAYRLSFWSVAAGSIFRSLQSGDRRRRQILTSDRKPEFSSRPGLHLNRRAPNCAKPGKWRGESNRPSDARHFGECRRAARGNQAGYGVEY